jgi:hypothetical protein
MEAFYRSQDMTREQAAAFTAHLYRLKRGGMDPTPPLARRDDQSAKIGSGETTCEKRFTETSDCDSTQRGRHFGSLAYRP